MAQVVAPGSPSSSPRAQHAPHGKKRAADNSLEHEQRLSKRFDLLNLGTTLPLPPAHPQSDIHPVDHNGTRLYIPVPGGINTTSPYTPPSPIPAAPQPAKPPRRPRTPRPDADSMSIDDTPHRVYIHDLAAELSDLSSDEDTPIFLSDIEKHLSKIPKHVLLGPEPKPTEHNQMVVYSVPTSLTVPEERDGVRMAIVEARRRIREGLSRGDVEVGTQLSQGGSIGGRWEASAQEKGEDEDGDAMDID